MPVIFYLCCERLDTSSESLRSSIAPLCPTKLLHGNTIYPSNGKSYQQADEEDEPQNALRLVIREFGGYVEPLLPGMIEAGLDCRKSSR